MTPEQIKAMLARIGENLSNQALVTELLTQIGDAYETTHTAHTALTTASGEKDKQIQDLQKTNMNLFLRVTTPAPINPDAVQGDKPMTYEDLIKDMGGNK